MRTTAILLVALAATAVAMPARRQATVTTYDAIGGYTPVSDIVEVSKIDEDQQRVLNAVAEDPVNFALAKTVYMSKIQATSTAIGDLTFAKEIKMKSDSSISVIQAYASYWNTNKISGDSSVTCQSGSSVTGCPNYADVMISAALNNMGDYEFVTPGTADVARAQIAKKGTAYQALWLYSIAHLSAAIDAASSFDTSMGTSEAKVGSLIDLAWAYYTGSQDAALSMVLARARGENFGTCSQIPDAILAEFKAMQMAAMTDTFDAAAVTTRGTNLVPLMTIPMVQGCIRYASLSDGMSMDIANAGADDVAKLAETWAFCSGLLPQLVTADAKIVRDMTDPAMKATIAKQTIIDALERNYVRMSITTTQVGVFDPEGACESTVSSSSGLSASVLLSLAAALVALVGVRGY